MKIAIAILNLGSRAMERYGDFFQIRVPGQPRLPHVFRHDDKGGTEDDRFYFRAGQEEKYTSCLERLSRDPRYRDRTLVTLAVPTLALDDDILAKKLLEEAAKIKDLESELERLQKAAPAVIVETEVKAPVIDSEPIQEPPAPDTPVETVTEEVTTPTPSNELPAESPPEYVTETMTTPVSEVEPSHVVTGELPEEAPDTPVETVTEEVTTPTPAKKVAKKQPKKRGTAADDANKPEDSEV